MEEAWDYRLFLDFVVKIEAGFWNMTRVEKMAGDGPVWVVSGGRWDK